MVILAPKYFPRLYWLPEGRVEVPGHRYPVEVYPLKGTMSQTVGAAKNEQSQTVIIMEGYDDEYQPIPLQFKVG